MVRRPMLTGPREPNWQYMTGSVKNVEVAGKGTNSAYLGFRLEDGDQSARYFVTGAAPGYEGEVFSATASLLVAAYVGDHTVSVRYLVDAEGKFVAQADRLGVPPLPDKGGG